MTVITQPAETGDDGAMRVALNRADIELAETGSFTLVVCESCGAFLPPDATSCPNCIIPADIAMACGRPTIHFGGAW